MAGKSENPPPSLELPARSISVLQKAEPSKFKWNNVGGDKLLVTQFGDSIALEGSVDWSELVQNIKYKLTLTVKLTGYHDITLRMLAYPPFQQVLSATINLSPSGELKVLNGPEFQVTGPGLMKYYVIVVDNVPPDDELSIKGANVVPVV
ncbi:hypothetical protein AXF42_Ash015842 [Apostasia shenzhenica]|uniref:Uncharacterized protein n=1 Tax=Apostasia shenzhenica TaxID=1088818 RepID=A0A2H9ZXR4_9ASPA|nr:hypothetical protein AXF42_Ash015842 [Apostasia shenzhenica]